jgi:hypothetical protein
VATTSDGSGNTELVTAMPRRVFVKGLLGGSLAILAGGAFLLREAPASARATSAQSSNPKRRLRGTQDGLVQESLDGGQTWQTVANFGSSCAVARLVDAGGQINADINYKRNSFKLKSTDARVWRTT